MSPREPVGVFAPSLPTSDPGIALGAVQDTRAAHDPPVDDLNHSQETVDTYDPARRALLASLLAACATSVVPPVFAAPAAVDARDAFLAGSQILTGRPSLDPAQAARLYDALLADDPQFAAGVQALVTLIDQRKIDPRQLQHVLDGEHSPLAALPRKIVTAWYVGVVGDGENARCITFETSLMNEIVSDKLKPPSYCYGGYGSWAEKP